VKFLRPVTRENQVRMRVDQAWSDNGPLGINNGDAVARGAVIMLEDRLGIIVRPYPAV
jgi:3-hydroxymyristoyl/3-hydroxydecanoyl-(acyl carrier protein) dehydratase